MTDYLSESVTPERLRARTRAVNDFIAWLRTNRRRGDHLSAATNDWASYIVATRRTVSARHAVLAMQHIDAARTTAGVTAYQASSVGERLRARINLDIEQASARYFRSSTDSYDIASLANYVHEHLPALPATAPLHERLKRLRIRALVLLRLSTAQRSKDATTIVRSSISEAHANMSGQHVLDFLYVPKGRRGAKPTPIPSTLQFHSTDESRCPARAVLALKSLVDALVGDAHDRLFIAERKPYGPIGAERAAKLVLEVMTLAGVDTTRFKAGSLRHMASEKWRHAGVPAADRNRRGNWSSSHVPNRHYTSAIPIDVNFAELAFMTPDEVRAYRQRGLTKRQDDGDAV